MASQTRFTFVASTYQHWTQHPDYIEACRTIPRPGDPTGYTHPYPAGAFPTDVTDFQVGMARWSENNLPDIMYQLWPCETWKAFRSSAKPQQKRDSQGRYMYERSPRPGQAPRPILDYPILKGIDKISTEVPWWFVEILFRLDPRLEWNEIYARMDHVGKKLMQPDKAKSINARNNACSHGRQAFKMISWREKSKNGTDNSARDGVLARLSDAQKAANTTRGSTPGPDLQGNLVPLPPNRRRGANTTTSQSQPSASTLIHSAGSSKRSRKVGSSLRNSQLLADNEDDNDDLDEMLQTIPRPKRRKQTTTRYILVEQEPEDSAASQYEPEQMPKPQKGRRSSSNKERESVQKPGPRESNHGVTKRPSHAEATDPQPKKRKVTTNTDEGNAEPPLHQPTPSTDHHAFQLSNTGCRQRHPQVVQTYSCNRIRPSPASFSANLRESNPFRYPTRFRNTHLSSTARTGPFAPSQPAYGNRPMLSNSYLNPYVPGQLSHDNARSLYDTYLSSYDTIRQPYRDTPFSNNMLPNTLSGIHSAHGGLTDSNDTFSHYSLNDTFSHYPEPSQLPSFRIAESYKANRGIPNTPFGDIASDFSVNGPPSDPGTPTVGNIFEQPSHAQARLNRRNLASNQRRRVVQEAVETSANDIPGVKPHTQSQPLPQDFPVMPTPRQPATGTEHQASPNNSHLSASLESRNTQQYHGAFSDGLENTSVLLANSRRRSRQQTSTQPIGQSSSGVGHQSETIGAQVSQPSRGTHFSSNGGRTLHGVAADTTLSPHMQPMAHTETMPASTRNREPRSSGHVLTQPGVRTSSSASSQPTLASQQRQQAAQVSRAPDTTDPRAIQIAEHEDVFSQFTNIGPDLAQPTAEAAASPQDRELFSWPEDPANWGPEWDRFVHFHNAEPLLRAHDLK